MLVEQGTNFSRSHEAAGLTAIPVQPGYCCSALSIATGLCRCARQTMPQQLLPILTGPVNPGEVVYFPAATSVTAPWPYSRSF